MKIQTPIVKPIPILRAVDTTRPIRAPFATRVASPADDPPVSSAMSAPRKDPTNAPITDPMIGTGIPTIAPTMPPRIAPQPARRDPPYFRAYLPVSENSSSSATNASTATTISDTQPIGSPGTTRLYVTADATMIQSPGRPRTIRMSDSSITQARTSSAISPVPWPEQKGGRQPRQRPDRSAQWNYRALYVCARESKS